MNEINLTPMVDILSAQLGEQVVMSGDSYVLLRDKSVVSSTDVDIATEEQNRLYLLAIEHAKPKVITPLQARLALSQLGVRQQVEDSMLTATQDIKDFYEFALEWRRDNTQLMAMATSLDMDSVAIDNFFLLASTL